MSRLTAVLSVLPKRLFNYPQNLESLFNKLNNKIASSMREEGKAANILDIERNTAFFNPSFASIRAIAVNLFVDDQEGDTFYLDACDEDEALGLNQFNELTQSARQFVTFNGFNFDIPFLRVRLALHSIRPLNPTFPLLTARYRSVPHYDIFQMYGDWGRYMPSLEILDAVFNQNRLTPWINKEYWEIPDQELQEYALARLATIKAVYLTMSKVLV